MHVEWRGQECEIWENGQNGRILKSVKRHVFFSESP